ncbi:MAG: carbohydrate ABC transporter permease [Chloroflexota bacterium]|nr:MAG: carbohydrate ABC transporter permease [Chloroflexota bacterium]
MTARSETIAVARVGRTGSPRNPAELTRTALLTTAFVAILLAFLMPLFYSAITSLKSPTQISQPNSPILPSDPATFTWNGVSYDVYYVPLPDGTTRELALVTPGRKQSEFIDPSNPEQGLISWQGSWRVLDQPWQLAPNWDNYAEVWGLIDFPLLLRNTILLALISTIGTVLSCTLVAYGFARFRFPGRGFLFTLLLATIFLPGAVTLIPTYTIFNKIGWVGTWLPLLVPAFFANAYDVFLLRQYLLTIPRDLDEAAMIDGASSLRILRSVVLPQAWPVIVAVSIFTFVYSWNDYFAPLIYLAGHDDLLPLQVGLARFNGIYYQNPAFIQAGNIMTLVIPVALFVLFQRVFIRGIVISGVEK